MTDRDTITRTRARAPGVEDHPSSMAVHRCIIESALLTLSGRIAATTKCTKGGCMGVMQRMSGADLSGVTSREGTV
jgi:hypothetical protein